MDNRIDDKFNGDDDTTELDQSSAPKVNATMKPLSGPKVSSNSKLITGNILDALRTSQVFKSRDELQEWAKEVCFKHGTIIVTQKYDSPSSGRKPLLILGCERGLKYREGKKGSSKRPIRRKSSTKRIGCPFKLKGFQVCIDGSVGWRLEVLCGDHNHDPLQFREGHSIAGRLKPHEKDLVRDMCEVGVKPKQVLQTLKKRDPTNCSTIQTIYNARRTMQLIGHEDTMELEQSSVLEVKETIDSSSGPKVSSNSELIASNIVEALRTSQVFKSRDELQEWAKEVCFKHGTVIVTQKYDSPSSVRNPRVILGCERGLKYREGKKESPKKRKSSTKRIGCPFKLKGFQVCIDGSVGWRLEVLCGVHNHDLFQFGEGHSVAGRLKPHEKDIVREMFEVGLSPRQVLQTLKKKDPKNCATIQTIYNARKAMQLIAREGRTHLQDLMKCIEDSRYVNYYNKDLELILQFQRVRERYQRSSDLVQKHTMEQMKELADPKATATNDLPMPIRPRGRPKGQGRKKAKLDASSTRDPSGFEYVVTELKSQNGAITRQPKGKEENNDIEGDATAKYMGFLPTAVAPYVTRIVDVPIDGHCGFRVVSTLFGMGEEGWKQVRTELRDELLIHRTNYDNMLGGEERVNELLYVLDCYSERASPSHWMSMPDMGHLIASRYGVALVHLSIQQCLTFLPLWSSPPVDNRMVAIGYVLNSHFVAVYLADDAPVPPIACGWKSYHHPCADDWERLYTNRSQHLLDMMDKGVVLQELPDVMGFS